MAKKLKVKFFEIIWSSFSHLATIIKNAHWYMKLTFLFPCIILLNSIFMLKFKAIHSLIHTFLYPIINGILFSSLFLLVLLALKAEFNHKEKKADKLFILFFSIILIYLFFIQEYVYGGYLSKYAALVEFYLGLIRKTFFLTLIYFGFFLFRRRWKIFSLFLFSFFFYYFI